jgi:hypothetical protein
MYPVTQGSGDTIATCHIKHPTCSTGQYLKGASATVLGTCTTCSNANCGSGKYRSGSCSGITDGYQCIQYGGSCSNGQLISATSRRQASHCGECNSGFYLAARSCTSCGNTQCAAGKYRTGSCSGTNDGYVCKTCTTCGTGEYKTGGCSGTSDTACFACSNANCASGKYRSGSCSGTTNGYTCTACASGKYKSGTNALTTCTPKKTFCATGETFQEGLSTTKDRDDTACTTEATLETAQIAALIGGIVVFLTCIAACAPLPT